MRRTAEDTSLRGTRRDNPLLHLAHDRAGRRQQGQDCRDQRERRHAQHSGQADLQETYRAGRRRQEQRDSHLRPRQRDPIPRPQAAPDAQGEVAPLQPASLQHHLGEGRLPGIRDLQDLRGHQLDAHGAEEPGQRQEAEAEARPQPVQSGL